MNTQKPGWICGFVALAIPLCGQTADKSHGCAKVHDDADRLACYDTAFGKPAPVAPQRPAAVVAPVPPTPAAGAQSAPVGKKAGQDAVADTQTDKPDSPREKFAAIVVDLSITPRGLHTVTLANGQVWRQQEPDAAVEISAGDTISVRPAALGSYLLITKAGVRTRVTRVK